MKIILKRAIKKERICSFTQQPFVNTNECLFVDENENPISWEVGIKQNFEVDKNFQLPYTVRSLQALSGFLDEIGIKHSSPEFRTLYKKLGEGLPTFEPPKVH